MAVLWLRFVPKVRLQCEAAALALGNFGLWGGISMPGYMIDSSGDSDKLELSFSA